MLDNKAVLPQQDICDVMLLVRALKLFVRIFIKAQACNIYQSNFVLETKEHNDQAPP